MTEILILLEFLDNPNASLAEVGRRIGISKQAVHEYVKRMTVERAFLEKKGQDNSYRVTFEGIETLQSCTVELENFAKEVNEKLQLIRTITAIAGNNIRENDAVGLFMENGIITAHARKKSSSSGISLHDAVKGEDVRVGSLKGIINHDIVPMILVKIPDRSRNCNIERLIETIEKNKKSKIAILDLVAMVVMKNTGYTVDIELAAIESSIDAVTKGIPVIAIGVEKSIDNLMRVITRGYPSLSRNMIKETVDC
ncbi:MAG: winged helix-turn-helix transcriptional regulator [Candidatus Hodarchaeales archaeon]